MATIVGLATLVALLKTQGVMSQLSYSTIGPKMTRAIAERMVLNVSYLGSQTASLVSNVLPIGGYNQASSYKNANSLSSPGSSKNSLARSNSQNTYQNTSKTKNRTKS
jgi:hypothetical protein